MPSPIPLNQGLEQIDYALKDLEAIICVDVDSFIQRNYSLEDELLSGFKVEVREVVEYTKDSLDFSVQNFTEEKFFRAYIQFHQRALIRLAGSLLKYMSDPIVQCSQQRFLVDYLYQVIQELLEFIVKRFSAYVAHDAWIPKNYQQVLTIAITPELRQLRDKLNSMAIDAKLISIVLSQLEQLTAEGTHDLSYYEVMYLLELKCELDNFVPDTSDAASDCLLSLLVYINYNTVECYHYFKRRFACYIQEIDSDGERMDFLNMQRKVLHQVFVKPNFSCNPERPSLKDQLDCWMLEEVKFYEGRSKGVPEDVGPKGEPFKTNLTVAEVAYLIRLLVKFEVIKAKRKISRIFRFVSLYIATDNTDSISVQGLNNRYHKADTKTRATIKALLLRMVAFIDRDIELVDKKD
jgi:hypothetical protein